MRIFVIESTWVSFESDYFGGRMLTFVKRLIRGTTERVMV